MERELTAKEAGEFDGEALGGVLSRIRALSSSLPGAERVVAEFIAAHPAQVVQVPISELANLIGVSTATIIRCTRSLGFGGLRELKYSLAVDAATMMPRLDVSVSGAERAIEIARAVMRSDMQAIADSIAMLDNQALESAAAALQSARRIEFFGAGASAPAATDAYYRFLRGGMPAGVVVDPFMQLVTARHLQVGDVAFAISHTGRTSTIINAIQAANLAGATTILLTSFARSPLARVASIVINTSARESVIGAEAISSRSAHASLIDALLAICILRREDGPVALRQTTELVEAHRQNADFVLDEEP